MFVPALQPRLRAGWHTCNPDTRKQAAMFRGGKSLRMAWHDRQNRKTTARRRAGSRLRLQSLDVGARRVAGHSTAQRVSGGQIQDRTAEICITEYV